MLKPTGYAVMRFDDGDPFTPAGTMSAPTASGGTLLLGTRGSTTALSTTLTVTDATTFAMTAANDDYRVVNRYQGGLLMLCDPAGSAGSPGTGTARFVAVAETTATGGFAATRLTDTTLLRGKTFYAMADCAYRSNFSGTQGQSAAHDADTLALSVAGDATVSLSNFPGPAWSSTGFEQMIAGVTYNGTRFAAYRFDVSGVERIVLVERNFHDDVAQTDGIVRLWLPD